MSFYEQSNIHRHSIDFSINSEFRNSSESSLPSHHLENKEITIEEEELVNRDSFGECDKQMSEEELVDYEFEDNLDDYEDENALINDYEDNVIEENEDNFQDICVLLSDCGKRLNKRHFNTKPTRGLIPKTFCDNNLFPVPYRFTYDFKYLPSVVQDKLSQNANKLLHSGKGILCIDETVTIGKRLKDIQLLNTEENRRKFREVLLTADVTLNKYISGVVFAEETTSQRTTKGIPFINPLIKSKIQVGIKLDQGQIPLYRSENESTPVGLDNLHQRGRQYKKLGFTFAVWHCNFKIGEFTPSFQAIHENARIFARFASICQSLTIVPIIEPSILAEGTHDIIEVQKITQIIISIIIKALNDYHIFLEGIILKLNIITPGLLYPGNLSITKIAHYTVKSLQRTVPPAVVGIILGSGVQSVKEFSENLILISKLNNRRTPWPITFSFGFHFQESIMRIWLGQDDKISTAQKELLNQIECLSDSILGSSFSKY